METYTGQLGEPGARIGSTSGTDEMRDKAAHLSQQARGKAMQQADARKDQLCALLEKLADELRDDQLGGYAADYARRGAEYLRRHDTRELMSSATATARSSPGMVLGASFVAGLAIARLLRR